jgi:hypothetical protein
VRVGRWLVVGLLAVAAGCGGDDGSGESSSAAEWAEGVCSASTTWTESVTSTAASLSGGGLTDDELKAAVDDFESATRAFADDLRGLGRPDTEGGEEAAASFDELADDVEENVAEIKSAVDGVSGARGVLAAVTEVSAILTTMGAQLSSAFAGLDQIDVQGELETAFEEADACNELETAGS